MNMVILIKETIQTSNFAKYILENNHNFNFDINKNPELSNTLNNFCIYSVFKVLHIHNDIF